MAPKAKVTKKDILDTAVKMIKSGEELNARSLAKTLGVSTQPIFSNYSGMQELYTDVIAAVKTDYQNFLNEELKQYKGPQYKAVGMGYIKYAAKEKNLFKLLFMRSRAGEKITDGKEDVKDIVKILQAQTGFDEETCYDLHVSEWIFVHGIASMIATEYLDWDEEVVSTMLTMEYKSKVNYIKGLKGVKA